MWPSMAPAVQQAGHHCVGCAGQQVQCASRAGQRRTTRGALPLLQPDAGPLACTCIMGGSEGRMMIDITHGAKAHSWPRTCHSTDTLRRLESASDHRPARRHVSTGGGAIAAAAEAHEQCKQLLVHHPRQRAWIQPCKHTSGYAG